MIKSVKLGKSYGQAHLGIAFDNWLDFNGVKRNFDVRGYANRVFEFITIEEELREFIPERSAIKLLRYDRVSEEKNVLDFFKNEVEILNFFNSKAKTNNKTLLWVTPMFSVGFYKFKSYSKKSDFIEKEYFLAKNIPYEISKAWEFSLEDFEGDLEIYSLDEIEQYWQIFDWKIQDGFFPFFIMQINEINNLQSFCEKKYLGKQEFNNRLPISDVHIITLQICEIFKFLHSNKIFYNDNKPIHFYWDPKEKIVSMIDWNAAKIVENISQERRNFDIRQFGIRTYYYLLFGEKHEKSRHGANSIKDLEDQNKLYSKIKINAKINERVNDKEVKIFRLINNGDTSFSALLEHIRTIFNI